MKKHIPNAITCCNLISGCVAVVFALWGNFPMALLWIVIGAVFDFFDGMTARLLGVSSPIGKELDSLADDITFGVAPSAMLFFELCVLDYPSALEPLRPVLPFAAFVMAAFSALRLAKFNLDERQTTSFLGLPTPANALFWASLLSGMSRLMERSEWSAVGMLALMCLSCCLLVSEIPMFALKFKQWSWRGNEVKYVFVLTSAAMILLFRTAGFALVVAWYVIVSLVVARRNPSGQP